MRNHSNDLENFASNRTQTAATRKAGEVIMNRIQKAAAAVIALTITLVGSVCVTAPMALADVQPLALHQAVSVLGAKVNTFTTDVMPQRS
jgi:hypothetical protein